MDLSEYRSQFPILQRKNYLNTCSLGALSRLSRSYVENFLNQWDEHGASAWYKLWIEELETVKRLIGKIIRADESEIALGHSISSILGSIGSSIDFTRRNKVVATDLDFPTSNYQWLAKEPLGVRTSIINSEDKVRIRLDQYRDAVEESTALVSTSHVFFTSGYIQNIEEINTIARNNGALCIIDAYQSAGQVVVDVHGIKIDMLMGGGLKWLLGGPGITFCYVRKGIIDSLQPTSAGWFGTKDQLAFHPDTISFHDDARRFETGTPALASVLAFKGGLEIVSEIGVENIRKATKRLTEELIERLKTAGFSLLTGENAEDRSAIVMIHKKNPEPIVNALRDRDIIVDYRKQCIRVSPYFYNTSEDLDKFVSALQELSK